MGLALTNLRNVQYCAYLLNSLGAITYLLGCPPKYHYSNFLMRQVEKVAFSNRYSILLFKSLL